MTQKTQNIVSKVNAMLNVDLQNNKTLWLSERKTLMKLVGVLGMLLPILIYGFLRWSTGHVEVLESISHYYYTRSNPIFIIIISLLAIFLMIYKYEKPIDFYLSFFAGFAALIVLLLPTSSLIIKCDDFCNDYIMSFLEKNKFRVWTHYIAAAIFLGILNYMCFFLFTKTDPSLVKTEMKIKRNNVYIFCGSVMTLALIVILLGTVNVIDPDFYIDNNLTFWMESLAVEAFGFSWLVKGGFILKDK